MCICVIVPLNQVYQMFIFKMNFQDTFLPHIEDGTIILIGATTENPSFHLNNALLSRCKLVALSQLTVESIVKILKNAVDRLGGHQLNEDETEKDKSDFR